jgi:hypothetical protein
MRNPTVGTVGQMFAVKAAVRCLAEATHWRIRALQGRRDRIVTGRGPGPAAIIIFV